MSDDNDAGLLREAMLYRERHTIPLDLLTRAAAANRMVCSCFRCGVYVAPTGQSYLEHCKECPGAEKS